ncbi:MAG TPA: sensor histidine kinase [Candidatus Saccharimonadales bacterium]|nr:sensor histidine kinase [Candidatus Saccharimonadales bacterium]
MIIVEELYARISASILARFALALFVTLLGLLIGRATHVLASDAPAYCMAFMAVALSTWLFGTGPAMASLALSLLTAKDWLISQTTPLRITPASGWISFALFLLAAILIIVIGETNLRKQARLRNAAGQLEEKIRDRTAELDHANDSLRQLTGRLLNLQDEERRRIARELHDNAGQALSALAMNLGAVAEDLGRLMKTVNIVADSASMVRQMSDDIRTMSYLLHPPLLDEMGLAPALKWYVEGFAERSKIAVDLRCSSDIGRLPREVETAIFRIVQECLVNIHRHSGSPTAAIQVDSVDDFVRLEVRDNGAGIPPELRRQMETGGMLGVGLRGMRERASQLGGSLEISADETRRGTCITVQLPATEAVHTQHATNSDETE